MKRHIVAAVAALLLAAAAVSIGCRTDNQIGTLTGSPSKPVLKAAWTKRDFPLDGRIEAAAWKAATPVKLEYGSRVPKAFPELSTTVRALWSERFLYLAFDCPYTKLTVFEPVQNTERIGLWERDVVEAFIGSDSKSPGSYTEYEVSPTNERLDVKLPAKDFEWSSGFESATRVNKTHWTAELRIPLTALSESKPTAGTRWSLNLYRCDYANQAFLAFNPTLTGTFHTPERFGVLLFE